MLKEAASAVSLTKDFFQFLNFLKGIVGADVISSFHRFDGTRVEGSSLIEIEVHKTSDPSHFYLSVKPVEAYVFVRFSVNSSGCEELIGTEKGETYSDPKFWRWVQSARSGTIVDGGTTPPNAKVDFVVVGYKPSAMIKYLSS